jgi:hypothetical protein
MAWITNAWQTGVGNDRHVFTHRKLLDEFRGPPCFIMLMIGEEGFLYGVVP